VSPDAVTAASAAVSALSGLALATGAPLWILPFACTLRLALDVLDGEVARASGRTTAFGGVLGDLNDGAGDALLYGGLAWGLAAAQSNLTLPTVLLLVLGLLGELAGVAAAAHGAPRGQAGPLGKVERMVGLSLVVLIPASVVAAWGLTLLALATLVRRMGIARRQLAAAGSAKRRSALRGRARRRSTGQRPAWRVPHEPTRARRALRHRGGLRCVRPAPRQAWRGRPLGLPRGRRARLHRRARPLHAGVSDGGARRDRLPGVRHHLRMGALLAVLVDGEPWSIRQVVGITIILAGTIVLASTR
jgi:phosphatidylglycerophosphate synthase